MWFAKKQTKQKQGETSSLQFLRKGLPKRRKHRMVVAKEGRHINVGTLFLWTLFFGTLFYTAFFSTFFLIGEPKIVGMNEVSEGTLRNFVDRMLREKYFGIFPRNNFFVVRPMDVEERLRSQYPLLASVSVVRSFPDKLAIAVTERKKIILWKSGEQTYLVDEAGVARDSVQALLPENAPYVLSVTDMSNKEVAVGGKVFDASYGTFVIQMSQLFPQELGLELETGYTTISRFAGELRVKTTEGWEAYFGTDIPIASSLGVLKLLFEKELSKEQRSQLAYIDLRAENRAYYALREGAGVSDTVAVPVPVLPVDKKIDTQLSKKKK